MARDVSIGGKDTVAFIKDREPVFDEETGTFICGEEIRPGYFCKGEPIAPRWRCRRHGGEWKPTGKALASTKVESIYTVRGLWKGYKDIHKHLTEHPEFVEQLYTEDIGEEVAISRVILANLLQLSEKDNGEDTGPNLKQQELQMQAIKLVAKIAKTATEIQERRANVIKRDFMNGIIAAVIHAFTRANAYSRQSDRARVFVSEFASLLPGNVSLDIPVPEEVIDGEVVDSG